MLTMSADNAVSEAVVGNSDVLIDLSDHIVHAWIIRTHATTKWETARACGSSLDRSVG